jgi:20S proteasome alpha/beta subunit
LLLVGADNSGINLFQVDPSGTHLRGSGFAIGSSSEIALTFMQKEYRKNMSLEQAIEMTYNAIEKALGEEPLLEGGIITQKNKIFNKINILEYIKK